MHLYLNDAREHCFPEDESPPVGLILWAQKDEALVGYSLKGLPNKVLASEDLRVLPDELVYSAGTSRKRSEFHF